MAKRREKNKQTRKADSQIAKIIESLTSIDFHLYNVLFLLRMLKPDKKTYVTNEMLQQAIDAILTGVENMMKNLRREMKAGFDELSAGQRDIKRRIKDIELDTSSRKEFDKLKNRIDKYHPMN